MKWKNYISLFTLIFTTASFSATFAQQRPLPPAPQSKIPDVFLITIDTLRADHVHCYGNATAETPALDHLASDGILFTNAFTPSPITSASHATILTGLVPSAHGVTNFGVALDPTHPTIAALLKDHSYQTAAFIGAVVLDSKTLAQGFDRGFDFYDNFPPPNSATTNKTPSRWNRVERRGKDVEQRAEKWLNAHRTGQRFVWVHLYDPHDPYDPPPPFSEKFRDRLYDGEIAYADSALADLLAYLKKNNWYDSALILVVGDHGEGLGEHGEETHGIFLYDSTTHVPLILKLPGQKNSGEKVSIQTSTTDIVPTILDVLNFPEPRQSDGQSLLPHLQQNPPNATRTAFAETDYPLSFGWASLRSVRTNNLKYIEAPRPEFYDLKADPHELHDLYKPWNADVQNLRQKLAAQRAAHPQRETAKSAATVGTGTTQELEALGYLGPADVGSHSTAAEATFLPDPKDKIAEQNLLHTAMLATDDNRTADARAALEKLLHAEPNSYAALLQLAQLELHAENFAEAAKYFHRAAAQRPDDAHLAYEEGNALNKSGNFQEAEKALQSSLKLNPNQSAARTALGDIYLKTQQFPAAQDQLEAALLIQPTLEAQLKLSEVFLAQKKFEEALQQLQAAIKANPDSADAFELLARAYTALNKPQSALQAAAHAKFLRLRNEKISE
jgi:choline-sulfatase